MKLRFYLNIDIQLYIMKRSFILILNTCLYVYFIGCYTENKMHFFRDISNSEVKLFSAFSRSIVFSNRNFANTTTIFIKYRRLDIDWAIIGIYKHFNVHTMYRENKTHRFFGKTYKSTSIQKQSQKCKSFTHKENPSVLRWLWIVYVDFQI